VHSRLKAMQQQLHELREPKPRAKPETKAKAKPKRAARKPARKR